MINRKEIILYLTKIREMKDLQEILKSREKSIQAHNDGDGLDDYDNGFRAGMQVAKIDIEKYLQATAKEVKEECDCKVPYAPLGNINCLNCGGKIKWVV